MEEPGRAKASRGAEEAPLGEDFTPLRTTASENPEAAGERETETHWQTDRLFLYDMLDGQMSQSF
jgi:hypothetical protein